MNHRKFLVVLIFGGCLCPLALAQTAGEDLEPTPEELDAAHSAEDEAGLWSDEIIDRNRVDPLGRLVAKADLVIRGNVVSQSYSYDADGVPFTHTKIAVTEVLHGDYTDAQFTVVQEGGPARDNDKRAMMVSSSRHFNVGEEEMLFLGLDAGGGAAGAQGRPGGEPRYTGPEKVTVQERFRILDGKVYSEDGRGVIVEEVRGGDGHRLRLSRDRNPAARFSEIHVGGITLHKNFTDGADTPQDAAITGAPGGDAAAARAAAPAYTDSSDVSALSAAITD